MGVKISDLTAASNVADANEFEINESGTSKKVTASQIKSYATNATSVTAAGALMDSELADVAAVKGINQALTTSSSPTFGGMTTTGDISFPDNVKAKFGNSDLQIYHDASNSYIYEAGTGDLTLQTNGTKIGMAKASPFEWMLEANVDGAVNLYYDGSTKLSTTAIGCDISGTLTVDGGGGYGNIEVGGNSGAHIDLKNPLSDDYDGRIITTGSGLNITTNSGVGAVNLQHEGVTTLSTTATGIDVLGSVTIGGASNTAWHAGNDGSGSGLDADTVDGYHETSFVRLSSTSSSATNGSFAIGTASGRNFIQSHNSQPLDINPLGNAVTIGGTSNTAWHAGNDGSGSGLDADTVDGIQGSSFLRSDADDSFSGTLTFSDQVALVPNNYGKGIYGLYTSTRYQHVWSMGTSYNMSADGTGVGNIYGLTWTHTNVGTGSNQAISGLSHQLQLRMNGNLYAAIGSGIWTSGNVTAYSDIAVKTNLEKIPDALNKVCQLNGYTYDRTDYEVDPETGEMPETRQAGVVAQEVEKVLPEVVSGEDGNKAVAYGNMVALLIEATKEQQAQIEELKAEIEELKNGSSK